MVNKILPNDSTKVLSKLRTFFNERGFRECMLQHVPSILAACEDPTTITTFQFEGSVFPLPQTNQMHLENVLLTDRSTGLYCVSYSYRNEPNPIQGRHDRAFPMWEFELPGTMSDLAELERDLCKYLGFDTMREIKYEQACMEFNSKEISYEEELLLQKNYGNAVMLSDFPERTSPFWNMKRSGNTANKIDVILCGQETIGSAERSCNPIEMRERFYTISDGKYSERLFSEFGKQRVIDELEEFLSFDFFPRSGGGIGMTRLISGMKQLGLI